MGNTFLQSTQQNWTSAFLEVVVALQWCSNYCIIFYSIWISPVRETKEENWLLHLTVPKPSSIPPVAKNGENLSFSLIQTILIFSRFLFFLSSLRYYGSIFARLLFLSRTQWKTKVVPENWWKHQVNKEPLELRVYSWFGGFQCASLCVHYYRTKLRHDFWRSMYGKPIKNSSMDDWN